MSSSVNPQMSQMERRTSKTGIGANGGLHVAWGDAPGPTNRSSAESAIPRFFYIRRWRRWTQMDLSTNAMCGIEQPVNRAFSARSGAVNIPGALPQAGNEATPSALNKHSDGAAPGS